MLRLSDTLGLDFELRVSGGDVWIDIGVERFQVSIPHANLMDGYEFQVKVYRNPGDKLALTLWIFRGSTEIVIGKRTWVLSDDTKQLLLNVPEFESTGEADEWLRKMAK